MKTKRPVLGHICSAVGFVLLALLLLLGAGVLLRPPQETYGSTWRAYRAEPRNSIDVLYLGSSCAYCDIDPVEIYRHSGLTGYVMGGSEQTMSLTYWYLRQCLETQTPQAVVFEATGVFFQRYQSFTQPNIAYMPFTLNRLGAICTAAEPELRPGLLLDLWFYHGRWKELSPPLLGPSDYKGYTPVEGTAEEIRPDPTSANSARSSTRKISPGCCGAWSCAGSGGFWRWWPSTPPITAATRSSTGVWERTSPMPRRTWSF